MEKKAGQVTNQQKIILGILALIGLIMFYTKAYVPLQDEIKESQETLDKKQSELTDMRKKAQQLDQLEKEFEVLRAQLKFTEKKLPKTAELPAFIRIITDIATKYGMDVANLSVLAPQNKQYYTMHSYGLQLTSDYHTFGTFFTEIVQLERIFNIIDVNFTPAASKDAVEQLSAGFSIVAYTSNE